MSGANTVHGANTVYPYLDAPRPLAFAHRGGAAHGDENTAEAFGRAAALGYRYIETDVHATADGVAVVFHDATLRRLTGHDARPGQLTWADLKTLRVGGAAAIPRLDEVLDAWPGLRFNIDVKAGTAVEPTLSVIRQVDAAGRVLLASFSTARLRRLRRAAGPGVPTSLSLREVAVMWAASRSGRGWRPPASVAAAQVPWRYGPLAVVDAPFVRFAHRHGLQVHVWTIDNPADIAYLLDLDVDGIMTDRVDVLRDVYAARGLWAPS